MPCVWPSTIPEPGSNQTQGHPLAAYWINDGAFQKVKRMQNHSSN